MKWFYNLKTNVKLITIFMVMAIILTFVGLFGLSNIGKMDSKLSEMYDYRLVPVDQITDVQILYQRMSVTIFVMATSDANEEKMAYSETIEEFKQEINSKISAYHNRAFSQEHEDIFNKFTPAWQAYNGVAEDAVQLILDDKDAEFQAFVRSEYKKVGDELNAVLNELVTYNLKTAEQANLEGDTMYASFRTITISVIIVASLLSIALGYFISQIIARPLNRVIRLVAKVADGDLTETADIDTKDEIGQLAGSINNMVLRLRETVGGILVSAENVSAAAQQISASTEEIASSSTSEAHAAQTMNELFRELSAAIISVAESAEQASELSNQTLSIAEEGGEVVRSSIDGMNHIDQQMSRLEDDSNKIGKIIEVIDDISDQTNLLALNAAIEAARAGDQGRGFAVVADEVRKLAERSSEATKQITVIIKGMQENTHQSVLAVGEGVVSSQNMGESFKNIIAMVNESAHKIGEIAAASEEQAAQSSEVLSSIEGISAATQESSASSEETASTALSLAQLAEGLNKAVESFKIK
ncbi:methyl-accepting chemotaxis protein [Paenibacillus aceti]|uniref:Methyl-accepting chemotaxis protein n=1 Tax=Paenibacillus aceti TaxID=1820010 RepID=A0ABQ1W9I2_9BACL|nr:methyl-accepting chemotaxis protein [Paenibacillus aceti]GGG18814.1 methyl-accepting chemotaxis protein [Paenibacillus aceti]